MHVRALTAELEVHVIDADHTVVNTCAPQLSYVLAMVLLVNFNNLLPHFVVGVTVEYHMIHGCDVWSPGN